MSNQIFSERHANARAMALDGVPIFPLHPGSKLPVFKDPAGWWGETADLAQIDAWWAQNDYNPAVRPWHLGAYVADDDVYKGVDEPVRALIPPTYRVRTPQGGFHNYMRIPEGAKYGNGKLATTIDGRCYHGYVALPGSVIDERSGEPPHKWGRYTIVDDREMAPMPERLVQALSERAEKKEGGRELAEGVTEVDEDPELTAIAERIIASYDLAGAEPTGDRAYSLVNKLLDIATQDGKVLSVAGVQALLPWCSSSVITNAIRHGQNDRGDRSADHLLPPPPASETFGAAAAQLAAEQKKERIENNRFAKARRTPSQGATLPAIDYWDSNKLLPRIPEEGCVVMLVGAKSSHKTGTVMKLCLDAIQEENAHILYLALEGGRGVEAHRLPAYREARGMAWADLDAAWSTVVVPFSITREKDHLDLAEAYQDLAPKIIVIDVLAKAAAGVNLSATEAGSSIMTMADNLARAFGATVIILNHPKRDGQTSIGSVFFGDLAYAELQCSREGELVKVYVEKMKDGEADRAVTFKIDSSRVDRVPVVTNATIEDLAEAQRRTVRATGPDPIIEDTIKVLIAGKPPIALPELTKRLSDQMPEKYGALPERDLNTRIKSAVWGFNVKKGKQTGAASGPLAAYTAIDGTGKAHVYSFAKEAH